MAKTQPVKSDLMAGLLGPQVVAWECDPALRFVGALFPEERLLIDRAVEKRQAEFATARILARRAMEELGISPQPLLRHDDRSPRWPDGLIGTITHTDGYCAVALASSAKLRGIGIDAEGCDPLKAPLIDRVCSESEISWLGQHPPELRGQLAKLVFSAKEAFYKCQYPLTRTFLGFKDVELVFDESTREFRVSVLRKLAGADARVGEARGRYRLTPDRILTAMVLQD